MKDDPSYVDILGSDEDRFQGICPKCHYSGPVVSSADTAMGLLNLHRTTREHKTNVVSQHRFTV